MNRLIKKAKGLYSTIINYVIGNSVEFNFDHKFLNSIFFLIIVITFAATIINYFLGIGTAAVILTTVAFFTFLFLYWLSRHRRKPEVARWTGMILFLLLLVPLWFTNGGSKGPIIFVFIVLFSYILLMLDNLSKQILITLIVIEIALLLVMELVHPEWVVDYRSEITRNIDIFSSLLMYFSLAAIIIIFARKNYIREKLNAEKSDYLKSAFLANMSHEIRTPMNSIIGFSQLLKRNDIEKEKKEKYIKVISDNGKYLLRLIGDIIDISKIESAQMNLIMTDVNSRELFLRLYTAFRKLLDDCGKKHITLSYILPPEDYLFRTDETRLEQILSNLILNAAKFTNMGSIAFGFRILKDEVEFFVKDTGIGIEKKNMDEIFDRFRMLDYDHPNVLFRGTGIGLSLSKSLVEMLGGSMQAESDYGHGSLFTFTIPLKGLKTVEESVESKNKRKVRMDNWSGKKILLVEDEESNIYLMQELFAPSHLEIAVARSGNEALEMLSGGTYDLVLMDIKLQGIVGYETARRIKQLHPDLPVIAQIAYAMESDEQKSMEAGCDDYISKPIDADLLNQKIKRFLKN